MPATVGACCTADENLGWSIDDGVEARHSGNLGFGVDYALSESIKKHVERRNGRLLLQWYDGVPAAVSLRRVGTPSSGRTESG